MLNLNILDGPVVLGLYILSALSLFFVLSRRPLRGYLRPAVTGLLGGVLLGTAMKLLLVDGLNLFGGPVSETVTALFIIGCGALGMTLSGLYKSRWPRKAGSLGGALIIALTLTLAINATYGLNPTVAAFLHINTDPAAALVAANPPATSAQTQPPLSSWSPPPDMPAHGTTGQLADANAIPNPASGFPARNAEIYYPPAALVKNPPALPFLLMMMGQPGDPTAKNIAAVLDQIAANHHGLAPIVIVADQLSDPTKDPLCLDTALGKAETYLMKDVTSWARSHLNILPNPAAWTIAGYSNGGQCANYFGAKYPALWGNILDVSGIEYAGAEQSTTVLKQIFAGNQQAYDAVKPAHIMAATRYADSTAIYTAGEKDAALVDVQQRMAHAASSAGITTHYVTIPGADHGVTALDGGLTAGFKLLYPRLGLSTSTP
ncbi:hypothetical protein B7R54_19410 [Subtercola boreus]|uniref:Esterase n=1 Tax=Subtercola boreus TaxID=120213 RepID=A0A3E0V9X3_9MICO|nr:esterase [Subtercola boreus]RFA06534.1 hypothetical protein B7R54_19410 [Subtercola boreus]TQL46833.1 enterochelin esterase-like enzyme [Subtercola boreus]